MTTTLKVWSGLHTIGANVIEVRGERGRVICDFGMTQGSEKLLENSELPETERHLKNGSLPMIPYLYDTRSFKELKVADAYEDPFETALFISHLHLDHMGGLAYLPSSTNVYVSEETLQLYDVLVEAGLQKALPVHFQAVPFQKPIQVGDLTVSLRESDHDIGGASSVWIESKDKKIIHSGDLRMSGSHPERVKRWVEEARIWKPDVLLLEGTTFSFENNASESIASEQELLKKWTVLMQEVKEEIIFFNPYPRNVERIYRIAELSKEYGRTLVFEPAFAQVLHSFYPAYPLTVLSDIVSDTYPTVSLNELQSHPEKYVLQNSYPHLDRTHQFTKGIYAHSNGEPLGDYDARYAGLLDVLEKANFNYHVFGTSGHASREDLLVIAKTVQAKKTVPWHTANSKLFAEELQKVGVAVVLPD